MKEILEKLGIEQFNYGSCIGGNITGGPRAVPQSRAAFHHTKVANTDHSLDASLQFQEIRHLLPVDGLLNRDLEFAFARP